jgi:hypothetical protein
MFHQRNIELTLTNDDSGDYAMILAMLSKLEAEDTSDDSSLSKIIDLFKIDLVDGTVMLFPDKPKALATVPL